MTDRRQTAGFISNLEYQRKVPPPLSAGRREALRRFGAGFRCGQIDSLIKFGDGDLDADLRQRQEIIRRQRRDGPFLVTGLALKDGQADAGLLQDDMAENGGDGGMIPVEELLAGHARSARGLDGGQNVRGVLPDRHPMRRRQHARRALPAGKVLLVPDVPVSRDHDRKAGLLCGSDQVAVGEGRPSYTAGDDGILCGKKLALPDWGVLLRQDAGAGHVALHGR